MESPVFRSAEDAAPLLVGDDYVTIQVSGRETGGTYAMVELTSKPGSAPPLHTHEYREAFSVLSGEYDFIWVSGSTTHVEKAGAGSTLIVPPHVPHTFRNASDERARMLILLAPAGFEGFFLEMGTRVDRVGAVPAGHLEPELAEFVAALERFGLRIVEPRE